MVSSLPYLLQHIIKGQGSALGRRKLPSKNVYVDVVPEVVSLENVLKECGIAQEQLIDVAILIGQTSTLTE